MQRLSVLFGLAALFPSKRSVLAISNHRVGKACREINLEWNSPEKEDTVITIRGGQDWCCRLRFKERGSIEELLGFPYNPCAVRAGRSIAAPGASDRGGAGDDRHEQCIVSHFPPQRSPAPGHLSAPQRGTGLAPGLQSVTSPTLPLPSREAPEGIAHGHRAEQRALPAGGWRRVRRSLPWCPALPAACSTAGAHDQGSSQHAGMASPLRRWLFLLLLQPAFVLPSLLLLMEKVLLLAARDDGPAPALPIPAGTSICSSCAGMRVSRWHRDGCSAEGLAAMAGCRGTHLHFARGRKPCGRCRGHRAAPVGRLGYSVVLTARVQGLLSASPCEAQSPTSLRGESLRDLQLHFLTSLMR